MAEYLKRYTERVHDLPANLQRRLWLIRDLDEKQVALQADIDAKCKQHLQAALANRGRGGRELPASKRQKLEGSPLSAEIETGMQKVVSYAEEKLRIASQVYDMVDAHIRELDKDLQRFDRELSEDRGRVGLKEGDTARRALGLDTAPSGADAAAASGGGAAAGGQGEQRSKRKYTRRKGRTPSTDAEEEAPAPSELLAAAPAPGETDASEPLYCLCNRVSWGQMVACDNPECLIEWFHYECVGLTEQPKGKWYCPDCAAKLGKASGGGGSKKGGRAKGKG